MTEDGRRTLDVGGRMTEVRGKGLVVRRLWGVRGKSSVDGGIGEKRQFKTWR